MTTLVHSPADIVRAWLIAADVASQGSWSGAGVYTGPAWPASYAAEPDRPDNCVTVYDAMGSDDGRSMIDGEREGLDGIQIRIRAEDHRTGRTRANIIWTQLCKTSLNVLVAVGSDSYLVRNFSRIGDILCLGKEPESKRRIFTINTLVNVEQR